LYKSSNFRVKRSLSKLPFLFFYFITGRITNKVIVHDHVFKEQLKNLYKMPENKIAIIAHGVSPCKSITSSTKNEELATKLQDKKIVLFFGFLSPRKGVEYLLQAFKNVTIDYTNCVLIVAGDAPKQYINYKKRLKAMTSELGLQEKVIFTGFVENEVADYLFSRALIFVLPYTFSSAASGPLSTAMQNGLPIIATRTYYFQDVLKNNYDSLLVPPSNCEFLAKAILKLLEDETLRQKFSTNIRKKAEQSSWRKIAKMTVELYAKSTGSYR
jgi:glycosyltransferase involved in cell wall biosynthesis